MSWSTSRSPTLNHLAALAASLHRSAPGKKFPHIMQKLQDRTNKTVCAAPHTCMHTYTPTDHPSSQLSCLAPVSTDTDGVKERYTGRQTDTEWQRLMLQPYNGSLPSLLYMYLLHISIHLPSTHTSFLYSASIYHSPPPSIPLYGLLVQPQSSRQQYSSIQSSYSSFNIIPCIMTFY